MGREELSHSLSAGPVQRRVATPGRSERRRGTVLILVVGVLVLVLLIGMALLETTRTESARVAIDKRVVDTDALVQTVVRHVLHLLREDLWGNDDILLNRNPSVNPAFRPGEVLDEPFDGFSNLGLLPNGNPLLPNGDPVPWQGDAWLSSTVPYFDPSVARLRWRRLSWLPLDEAGARASIENQFSGITISNLIDNVGLPINDVGTPAAPRDSADAIDNRLVFDSFRRAYLDADGDGIRDSVRLPNQFAGTAGQRFDVAIRIVDHGSMLNVNTASDSESWRTAPINPPPKDEPEKIDALGRYVTNLRVEPVLGFNVDLSEFVTRRATDPVTYAEQYVRAGLLSGWPMPAYLPADSEASLRYRHLLVPFRTVTGLGRKPVETDFFTTLVGGTPQYRRYNETEPPSQGEPPTWMSRMDPDNPEFVLRPLVTTISKDHQRIAVPRSVVWDPSLLPIGMNLPMLPAFHPQTGERIAAANRFDLVDVNANPLVMRFVRNQSTDRVVQVDPQFALPDELSGATAIDPKVGYAGQLAAVMWLVLEGDEVVPDVTDGDDVRFYPGVPAELTPELRRRLAWQFAVNVIDFRDADQEPTVISTTFSGLQEPVYGFEAHPFITEVYAELDVAGNTGNNPFAIELHNPFDVDLDLTDFVIATSGGSANLTDMGPLRAGEQLVVYSGLQSPQNAWIRALMPLGMAPDEDAKLVRKTPTGPFVVDRFTLFEPNKTSPNRVGASGTTAQTMERAAGPNEVLITDPWWQWQWNMTAAPEETERTRSLGRVRNSETSFLARPSNTFPHEGPTELFVKLLWSKIDWNRGLDVPWTFNSLLELSKVFLIGADLTRTVPERVADAQTLLRNPVNWQYNNPDLDVELDQRPLSEWDKLGAMSFAGRIDFVHAERVPDVGGRPWSHRIFDYFSVNRMAYDTVDNDGDGIVDELTEDYDMNRTVAGRLNINTASGRVLRASLVLSTAGSALAGRADVIAAFRDGQPLRRPDGQLIERHPQATGQPPLAALQPFVSVADLTQIDRNWLALASLQDSFLNHPFRFAFTTGEFVRLQRDQQLSRVVNLLTVRSDVYTIYIALVDRNDPQDPDDDVYVRRVQLTVDRTNCYRSPDVLPEIIARQDSGYYDMKR